MTDGPDDDGEPYKVGYGRPPKEHRFQRGKPQNFKRKRKASRSRAQMIHDLANEKIEIIDNKRKRKVSADEAGLRRLRHQALSGQSKAQRLWFEAVDRAEKTLAVKETQDTRWDAEAAEGAREFVAKFQELVARRHGARSEPPINIETLRTDNRKIVPD